MKLAPGQVIEGRYVVGAVLHDGPLFGVVAATHVSRGTEVAIKILGAAGSVVDRTRFMSEARLAARIQSEHTVAVLDFGVLGDRRPYLVMELAKGTDLGTLLARGPLDPASAIAIARQICAGLEAIHRANIVHRNLEPSNVIVLHEGPPSIKIIDFFLARELGAPHVGARANTLIGTTPYAAPEQLRDPLSADGRSDLWSLGGLLCTMVSGRPPYEGPSIAEMIAAIHEGVAPAIPPSLPPALRTVIERCLAHDPADRYQTATALAAALAIPS